MIRSITALWMTLGATLLFISYSLAAASDESVNKSPPGFLWYNLPKTTKSQAAIQTSIPFSALSYTQRDEVLRFYTMEALHKARQTKSVEDMRIFLVMQDYWLKESSKFSELFQKALVYYPQFDYSVTHPTSSLGTKMLDESRHDAHGLVIRELAKTHGVLFFYRGNNAFDSKQIPIIRDFCTRFGLYLIPVSVDGVISPELDNSKQDNGQANRLQVRYFPAILLVDPSKKEILPVAYGLTTQDVLEKRLFQVATNFHGESV